MKKNKIDSLIEALEIGKKYAAENENFVHCERGELWLCIDPMAVNDQDRDRLEDLGFSIGNDAFIEYFSC